MSENAATDTNVGALTATDDDNDIMGYNITAGDANSVFTIDSSGNLKVNGALNHETTSSYTLTVQANDMAGNSAALAATVTVNITDVDENPVFSPVSYTFSVAENAGISTTVGSLFATDLQNDIMGYSITAGDPNSIFTVDSSGNLKVNCELDYETTSSYTLTVQANDMGGHSATLPATVTVNITDISGDNLIGWTVNSPNATVYLDQLEGDMVVSGNRGTNPDGLTIHLSIWDLNDEDATSPWMALTIPNGIGATWAVGIGRTVGRYMALLWWDGMPELGPAAGINNPRNLEFAVEANGGDPIPP